MTFSGYFCLLSEMSSVITECSTFPSKKYSVASNRPYLILRRLWDEILLSMISRPMRNGFGASVNTCKTCSITARLVFFICAGKGILVFDTVGGHHFRARESTLSIPHSFIHWKMVRVAQGWPLTIYYLLFHTSFFHSFVCFIFFIHPTSILSFSTFRC